MAKTKIACWNIYFSWTLVEKSGGKLRFTPKEKKRADNVGKIIRKINADMLGIIECMSAAELKFLRDNKCKPYDGLIVQGKGQSYNLGLLYKKSVFVVKKEPISSATWKAKIGDDKKAVTYKFTRVPLVVSVTHKKSGKTILLAVVHAKSKRPKQGLTGEAKHAEARRNRKRIVAEGVRLRELLAKKMAKTAKYKRMMIMGDINDGPDFDRYEKQIYRSGIESHIGSVLDPESVLHSFVDLSDGKGEPSSSFAKGSVQLDHMIYTHDFAHGKGTPKVTKNGGKVRSDLVNIKVDGKKRDSDHAPTEIRIDF